MGIRPDAAVCSHNCSTSDECNLRLLKTLEGRSAVWGHRSCMQYMYGACPF